MTTRVKGPNAIITETRALGPKRTYHFISQKKNLSNNVENISMSWYRNGFLFQDYVRQVTLWKKIRGSNYFKIGMVISQIEIFFFALKS